MFVRVQLFHLASSLLLLASLVSFVQCTPTPIDLDPANPIPTSPIRCDDGPVPLTTDCLALVAFIRTVAKRPGENLLKRWGRSQQEAPRGRTAHLPKKYYMKADPYSPPRSCMFYLDDSPVKGEPDYDTFRMSAIADLGERLLGRCLINEGRGGRGFPGNRQTVYSQMTRYSFSSADGLASSAAGNGTALLTEKFGNETLTLYEEDETTNSGRQAETS